MYQAYGYVFDPKLATTDERVHLASFMAAIGMPGPTSAADLTSVFQIITKNFREISDREAVGRTCGVFLSVDQLLVRAGL
ncbi:MAG TPA: hypothetical protein VEG64_04080 [Candidatus Sulfotelmatobacter sp.]|nr:hypothetical protein [Candidatus Sulfotelmatobacter sp.]